MVVCIVRTDYTSRVVVDYELAIDRVDDDDTYRLQVMSTITCGIVLYTVDQDQVYFRSESKYWVFFQIYQWHPI